MKEIMNTSVTVCGTGAIGSNLAMNLVRQGFFSLILIDHDRVDLRNLSTQIWSEPEIGLLKTECLGNRLFDELGVEVEIRSKKLTVKNAKKLLQGTSIIVDSFDNAESRQLVRDFSLDASLPCLHVGLNADYAEVIWNEDYRVPSSNGEDVCDYPLARNLILMAVAVASENLIRYIVKRERKNYTITLGDFAVQEF